MVPSDVLAAYGPPFAALRWSRAGGGFSGAAVFVGSPPDSPVPSFCLKAWPPGISPDRVRQVHHWMAAARRHSPLVPDVFPTRAGPTWVEAAGRVWDLAAWMPGAADFRAAPSDAKLAAACEAVAALHRAWWPPTPTAVPFPAVARRLAVLRDWRNLSAPPPVADPDLAELAREATALLPRWAAWAEAELAPLAGRPVPVQPCLCDVHHDHVLFRGDAVSGVIDYGAMKLDHPAADLARLLGDLVGDDAARVRLGVDAYRAAGGAADVTADLVTLLDRTGTVGAAANWLLRLTADPAAGGNPAAAAARLGRIVRRLGGGFA